MVFGTFCGFCAFSYKPFHKPNSEINYIHRESNHPPSIIKQLSLSVESRLSKLSSNENIFIQAVSIYQEAFKRAGYNHKLSYNNSIKHNNNSDNNNNNNNNNSNNNNNNSNNNNNKNKYDINSIQIGKRQLHFIQLNHVLFDLNKLSKDTASMFTFTPFSSVKLTASKNF